MLFFKLSIDFTAEGCVRFQKIIPQTVLDAKAKKEHVFMLSLNKC